MSIVAFNMINIKNYQLLFHSVDTLYASNVLKIFKRRKDLFSVHLIILKTNLISPINNFRETMLYINLFYRIFNFAKIIEDPLSTIVITSNSYFVVSVLFLVITRHIGKILYKYKTLKVN